MTDPLWQLSACDIAEGIRRKTFSCEAVMASVTERIAERNPALNAIVYDHSERAMDQARSADRALAAGTEPGPLYGVPVTIKSNIDVEGEPTPNGLPVLKDAIAPSDSPVVRNLKNAGAIIVGRTNTPEFSMRMTTDNPLNGRTFSPWHEDACPGGSSGGASSAAAAGFGAPLGRHLVFNWSAVADQDQRPLRKYRFAQLVQFSHAAYLGGLFQTIHQSHL